ncbi:MAG TPA: alpha-L-arabinofuranosidase C-terminal domain-containing protein [Anaerolineaceae bacterium]
MPAIPEFILRKLFVRDSYKETVNGFSFMLTNRFAAARVTGFQLEVDGKPVDPQNIFLQIDQNEPIQAGELSETKPIDFPVGITVRVQVNSAKPENGKLAIHVTTVEAGALNFSITVTLESEEEQAEDQTDLAQSSEKHPPAQPSRSFWQRLFQKPYQARFAIDADEVIGEINPYIYGQFVEHLENCVYNGIWTADGAHLQQKVLGYLLDLKPSLIRYPGGNFASGYHWEDGIGPLNNRPRRYDPAWKVWETNRVGTDEFMDLCSRIGAHPYLVVNDGSGTPAEAARWVAYCNDPATSIQGHRRAANGHKQPYNVRLWGIGNEVWGPWQVGHTTAQDYATRLHSFSEAMRSVDPEIKLVAVGDGILTDEAEDPGRLWNQAVLAQAQDFHYLSFHVYHPGQDAWQENYDPDALYHTVCAAPYSVEAMIQRMSDQIESLAPGRNIRIALDEWNLHLPPDEEAASMHQINYTLGDAFYVAGMLNAFQRQCTSLAIANLAQLVNVLPLIISEEEDAFATASFYAFQMYRHMQPFALKVAGVCPTYAIDQLGNIASQDAVPYLDLTATRNASSSRLTLGILNRHPSQKAHFELSTTGFHEMRLNGAWILTGSSPYISNDWEHPTQVSPRPTNNPFLGRDHLEADLPPVSLMVIDLSQK